MSSSKRKRLQATEEEAGPSTPWKKYGLDVDTLECPICTEPFSPPVFQCVNGHAACSTCCEKMNTTRGCPFCSLPIGHIRCLAIEKVVGSLWVECCHDGCATKLRFRDRDEHERSLCVYRRIKCPRRGCIHKGPISAISEHLSVAHDTPTVQCESIASFYMGDCGEDRVVFVQAKEAWFLVSSVLLLTGHKFTCESVWASKKDVEFKLTVQALLQIQKRLYSMESAFSIEDHSNYLFVPGNVDSFRVTVSLNA